ncbi:MAG: secretion system protein F [Deltaproteobacteria bacterium]|nr:MAG: secretion system protein F [Deltaproteobacteria bacterium]
MEENLWRIAINSSVFLSVSMMTFLLIDFLFKTYNQYREKYLALTTRSLDQMFLFYTPEQVFTLSLMCMVLLAFVGFLISFNLFLTVLMGVAGFFLPRIVIAILKQKRLKKFEAQLVPALDSIANSFQAGFTLLQAMDLVATEEPAPLSQEFALVLQEHKLGRSVEEALQNMADRVGSEDLQLVVNSLNIARSLGGNMAEMLQTIAATIRERNRLEGRIRALTAQGKMQGMVVGAMPFILALFLYMMQADKMQFLFTHWIGWILCTIIIILEILGAFFIKKVVTIDI